MVLPKSVVSNREVFPLSAVALGAVALVSLIDAESVRYPLGGVIALTYVVGIRVLVVRRRRHVDANGKSTAAR